MKKSLIYTLSGAVVLSATAIATGVGISISNLNLNNDTQSIENNVFKTEVIKMNDISLADFQLNSELKDVTISQEIFDSNHLYVWQGSTLVNYGNYYISGDKGIGSNLSNPVVQKFLIDSLNYNNNLNFDYENFEYNFTSGRFIYLDQDGYTRKVVVNAQIQVKSKLNGEIVNTYPLQFMIDVQDIVLFNNPCSVLERMGINMVNDGTYGLKRWVDANHYVQMVEISKRSIEEEDKWFFEYWENQQKEYVKKIFGVEDPKIEPIKINKTYNFTRRRQHIEILMDKSKDTFYDTFRAVYGVDYQEAINKLINEGRGSEAALLESMHKIKLFGQVDEIRNDFSNFQTISRNFMATGLQIFLNENETIGFGIRDTESQQYQRLIGYSWEYKKYI